jgi:PrgI family protein
MIEVRIPKEIREYKTKYFFNLTLRQSLSTLIALLVCVPLYFFGKTYINEDLLSWLIILIAMPLCLIGFFSFNQMTFEKFVLVWFRMQWNKQKRPYQYLPIYSVIRNEYLKEQHTEILNRLKLKERKKSPAKSDETAE